MGSFRKRLLVLIIGLVIVTQTVTLAAVLVSTRRTVEARAAEQLRSGGTLAEHLIGFRAGQLANGVGVLAADFGFREAVASGHTPTILSAARNNAQRIGADMVLLLDTQRPGARLDRSVTPTPAARSRGCCRMRPACASSRTFACSAGTPTSCSSRRYARPETIAWVAMGFVADDSLAARIRDLVGSEVAIVTHGADGVTRVAVDACRERRIRPPRCHGSRSPSDLPHVIRIWRDADYLSFARRLDVRGDSVDLILLKPWQDVLAPYRDLRDAMLLIDGHGAAGRGADRRGARPQRHAPDRRAGARRAAHRARGSTKPRFGSPAAMSSAASPRPSTPCRATSPRARRTSPITPTTIPLTQLPNRALRERASSRAW